MPTSSGRAPGLREQLRLATRDQHDALEATPFFTALVGGTLPKVAYVAWLRIMAVVVGELERALDSIEDPTLRGPWTDPMRKLPLLRDDLLVFDEVVVPSTRALPPTLTLVECVRQWAAERPARLLGALYVIEGSTLGGQLLRNELAAQLGLDDGRGLAYVSSYGARTGSMWRAFCRRLDAVTPSPRTVSLVLEAAEEFMRHLGTIITELYPFESVDHVVVDTLNPDAGRHHTTRDPREVLAAVDAGLRTWELYPYYEARYGARGRRFTRSDSGWIVTLVELSANTRREQVRWLTRLLATRGMPSLLLEEHLRHLHEALVAAVPERAARYAALTDASLRLRAERLAALPTFDTVAASFPERETLPRIGPILASAIADERNGIKGTIASVEGWLTDPARFDADWIAAVHGTLAHARESVG